MLLLDEPFGALDAKVRQGLRAWLRRLHDQIHVTTLLVTHDQEEALEVADRVVVMNQARIEQVGRRLLERYGVVFKRVLARERLPVPWRDLVRLYRHQELRGEVRGGRFVQRFSGEQYALPEAVELMRRLRRGGREIRATAGLEATPILVVTALNDPKVLKDARRFGANAHLVKPVDAVVLWDTVQKLLPGAPRG